MISAQGTGDSDRPATGEKDLQDLIWEVIDFGNILLFEEGMNGDGDDAKIFPIWGWQHLKR
jgi:hypothetical protein